MPRAISLLCLAAAAALGGCASLRPLVADEEHHSARFNVTCEVQTYSAGKWWVTPVEHRWFAIDLERGIWAEADGSNPKAITRGKGDSISRLYGSSSHYVQQWFDLSSGRFYEDESISDPPLPAFQARGDCRREPFSEPGPVTSTR